MAEDFSGQNLRGRSFKGHDLTGANFAGADIRGANFKGARLAGAIFTDVKAGLSRRFQIVLSFISILGGGFVGMSSAFSSILIFASLYNLNIDISHMNLSFRLGEISIYRQSR